MKVIIFNGPPDSGKDEGVLHLVNKFGVHPFSFKSALVDITCRFYDVSKNEWDSWYTREGKEKRRAVFHGKSQRQALIHVSENVLKPSFGQSVFGMIEASKLKGLNVSVVAAGDGGFNDEVEPLVKLAGAENVHIVLVRREGRSFAGDSRNWIDTDLIPDENYVILDNNGTLEEFQTNVSDLYHWITQD